MKRRGPARKHNPSIPAHIDQGALPRGVYWDASGRGRWYVFVDREGRKGTLTIAQRGATLADLHGIMEFRTHGRTTGSVRHVVDRYMASARFARLSPRSQKDYAYNLKSACAFPTTAGPLGTLMVDKLSPPVFARIRDAVAKKTPAKANAWIRRLGSAFAWGLQDGSCKTNPCAGIDMAPELARTGMPSLELFRRVQAFALRCGALPRGAKGHVAPYLADFMEIAYQSRLRCVEVLALTDAHITPDGILCKRTKGSRANVARLGPLQSAAIARLQARRKHIMGRRGMPAQIRPRPEQRHLFIGEGGEPLTYEGLSSAWQRMMAQARAQGVLAPGEGFTAHGLKHRGITDSTDKAAGGHKSEQMRHRYDHSVPIVESASDPVEHSKT